ncbi:MAG: DNA cytosine methyltransferase, partial [Candidatus Sumerlaeota bacterium]|nr:DNA cytosine methyltransferase [Candidatus Sumerlaeota bacterium]
MNIIDLFCGCGGLSYGFQNAGFKVLLGIDNDPIALKTFQLTHPGSKIICGDISRISKDQILNEISGAKVDVIVGGPPCQGFSLSGPRNLYDPRNKLLYWFLEVVKALSPKAVLIENVPGIKSLYGGKIREAIVEKLESKPFDYKVNTKVLTASEYGVPQHRKRFFIIGIKGKRFIYPKPTYVDSGCGYDLVSGCKRMVSCEDAISDLPLLDDGIGTEFQQYRIKPINDYQRLMRKSSDSVHNHIAARHSKHIRDIIALVPEGKNYKSLPIHLRNTRNFHVAWTRFPRNEPAPTIDTGHRHHFHYEANRVPTVRECARLQSFPDIFHFIGNKT